MAVARAAIASMPRLSVSPALVHVFACCCSVCALAQRCRAAHACLGRAVSRLTDRRVHRRRCRVRRDCSAAAAAPPLPPLRGLTQDCICGCYPWHTLEPTEEGDMPCGCACAACQPDPNLDEVGNLLVTAVPACFTILKALAGNDSDDYESEGELEERYAAEDWAYRHDTAATLLRLR
jgi:hypothetical protein